MKYVVLVIAIWSIPMIVCASVRITEVAWMGTTESAYGEWIELYNDSDEDVDLKGWRFETGGATLFTLSKNIPGGEYFLVERVTASQNPIPDVSDEEGSFSGGGLSDKGEDLVLKDSEGSTIQSLLYAGGWPAGDAKTKDTMQWNGSAWITAIATPKSSTSGESTNDNSKDQEDSDTASTPLVKGIAVIPKVSPNKPHIDFIFPKIVYRGVSYQFIADPILEYDYHIQHGFFLWNMGDGTIVKQYDLSAPFYTYSYSGTYTVSFAYYEHDWNRLPVLLSSKVVQVLDASVNIAIVDGGALRITNTSNKIVDISDWRIIGTQSYTIPPMTSIAPKAIITIPTRVLGFQLKDTCTLQAPDGGIVASVGVITRYAPTPYSRVIPQTSLIDDTEAVADVLVPDPVVPLKEKSHTKTIFVSVAGLLVITLFVLLERAMVSKE